MTEPKRGSPAIEAATELARVRDEIEQIDRDIIILLARRLALGKRTGSLKRAAGRISFAVVAPETAAPLLKGTPFFFH